MTTIHKCPFCGREKVKVSAKHKWGWNNNGRIESYTHYCMCNVCHAKGPVTTISVPNPCDVGFKTKKIEDNQEEAIRLWNQAS